MNTYAATGRSPRFINWMHTNFGLGAALGPLIMTGLISNSLSWRWDYAIGGVMALNLMVAYLITHHRWRLASNPDEQAGTKPGPPFRETLRLPLIWLGIATFFVFVCLEVLVDKWSYPLFAQSRDVAQAVAEPG